jgi:Fe2+ transport system protein FeoA
MSRTLDQLQAGDETRVLELNGAEDTAHRLMEMGLLPGTPIQVVRFAPLGDPIEISVRGYHLSLRRTEAADIVVE